MKRLLVFLTLAALAVAPRAVAQGAQPESACGAPLLHAPVLVGMTDTAAYFPKLKGLRVGVGRLVCRGLPPTGRSIWSICCTAADSM